MSTNISTPEISPLVLHFGSFVQNMSDHEFLMFCRDNPDLRIERTAEGDLIVTAQPGANEKTRESLAVLASVVR